jgi:hypothetical protein
MVHAIDKHIESEPESLFERDQQPNVDFDFWRLNPQFLPPVFVSSDQKRMIAEQGLTFQITKIRNVNTNFGPNWWLSVDWGNGIYVLSLQDIEGNESRHELIVTMQEYLESYKKPIRARMTLTLLSNGNEFYNIVPPMDEPQLPMEGIPF